MRFSIRSNYNGLRGTGGGVDSQPAVKREMQFAGSALRYTAEGFALGIITDFEAEPANEGDAFVIAPDGTRAGLVWSVSDEAHFERLCPDTDDLWGVWAVSFSLPMSCRNNARSNLADVIPAIKPKWQEWRRTLEKPEVA